MRIDRFMPGYRSPDDSAPNPQLEGGVGVSSRDEYLQALKRLRQVADNCIQEITTRIDTDCYADRVTPEEVMVELEAWVEVASQITRSLIHDLLAQQSLMIEEAYEKLEDQAPALSWFQKAANFFRHATSRSHRSAKISETPAVNSDSLTPSEIALARAALADLYNILESVFCKLPNLRNSTLVRAALVTIIILTLTLSNVQAAIQQSPKSPNFYTITLFNHEHQESRLIPSNEGLMCTGVMNMRAGPGTDFPIVEKCEIGTFIKKEGILGVHTRGGFTWIAIDSISHIRWMAATQSIKLSGLSLNDLPQVPKNIIPTAPTTHTATSMSSPSQQPTQSEESRSASEVNAPILASLIPASSHGKAVFFYNFTPPSRRDQILSADPSNTWATDRGFINPHESLTVKGLIAEGYFQEAAGILWAHILNPATDGNNQYISYLVSKEGPVQSEYAGLPFSIAEGALLLYKNAPAKDKPQYLELLRAAFNLTSSTVSYWKQRGYTWRDHWESVRDQADLPMWAATNGAQNQVAFDLVAHIGYSCKLLEEMAKILGVPNPHQQTYSELYRLAQSMWDPNIRSFTGKRLDNGQSVGVLDISAFLSLIAGFATPEQAKILVQQHLMNPNEFWTSFPLPTIPQNDPMFDAQALWKGGNMSQWTVLIVQGLIRYGYMDAAREIANRSGGLNGSEYYNSNTGIHQGFPGYVWGNSGKTMKAMTSGQLRIQ